MNRKSVEVPALFGIEDPNGEFVFTECRRIPHGGKPSKDCALGLDWQIKQLPKPCPRGENDLSHLVNGAVGLK